MTIKSILSAGAIGLWLSLAAGISWAAQTPAEQAATASNLTATAPSATAAAPSASLGQKLKDTASGTSAIQDKIVGYLIENGPKLIGALIILLIGFLIARSLGKLIMRWLTKREMEPPVRMLITRISKLLVTGFALVIALGTLGFNIMALVTGIGVAGVGISLATQGVLSNLVAGLMIIFTKPFRVGEYVEVVGVYGQVSNIDLFSTTLLHGDRSRVVIPNRRIAGEVLHNYGTIRQLDLTVGVAYDTNLAAALSAVRNVLKDNSRILKDFSPIVGISALGDSSINISVKPWVAVNDYLLAQAEVYQAIVDKFRATGIQIPFPQREIRLLNGVEVPPAGKLAS